MENVALIIIGMALVTYLPRFLPMYILTRLRISPIVIAWLRYVPVAVLSALIVPGVATSGRHLFISSSNLYLLASVPAFYVAWRTRSMLWTMLVGMALVFGLQLFIHA